MAPTTENLQSILNKIYAWEGKAVQSIDRTKFETFLQSVLNGDQEVKASIAFGATLGKGGNGIVAYLLTEARLIRIRIDDKGDFDSADIYITKIVGVNRQLSSSQSNEENDAKVKVVTDKGFFGLEYVSSDTEIENFFSQVEAIVRKRESAA